MDVERERIEARLKNMKKIYLQLGNILDQIPETIPDSVRNLIRDKVIGDKELKELMDGIDHHRPPRFLLIGRTGVGKSSLINALTGCYLAQVSDTESCTANIQSYKCTDHGTTLMEILDTRGIAESDQLDSRQTAEDQLLHQVNEFSPDAAIFLLNCAHRDSVGEDADYLKAVIHRYESLNHVTLPIVVVCTRADEVAPSRLKNPQEYTESKIDNIEEIVQNYKNVLTSHGLRITSILAVSSCIDWMNEEGEEVSVETINSMTEDEISKLQIAFDGRYQIEELRDILEHAIEDFRAIMGLRMALRLDELVKRLAIHMTNIFSTIAGGVAVTPIPISDIYILLIIQAVLVMIIAALSGREVNLDMAKEFIFSMFGVGGAGYVFRLAAQQASKLLNTLAPWIGSAISSGIAVFGTKSIGKAAIAYYLDKKSIEEAAASFKENNRKALESREYSLE